MPWHFRHASWFVVFAALVGGCAGAPATSQAIRATPSPAIASTLDETVEPAPTPSASAWTCEAPIAPGYYCATKNAEGGHGGPPLLHLPEAVVIDYRVSGTCNFSLGFATETSSVGLPSLTVTATGPLIAGTWRPSLKPGRYYPVIGEAVGCVYSVNVRADR